MTIDTIGFDWSGTLSNDFDCVIKSLNDVLGEYGVGPVSAEHLRQNYEKYPVKFYRKLGITDSKENIHEKYKKHYDENYRIKRPEPFEDIELILAELYKEHKKLMVLSTHPQEFLEREVKEYGFYTFFDGRIFGDVSAKSLTIKEQSANLNNFVMVGDTWVDMEEGKKAGVVTIGVLTGYNYEDKLEPYADHILKDLSELPDLLRRLEIP
ncbi:HAD family hydrolase [Candidatus Woesearchaeota archaeon]|nr:HAD family hydrolase [Candidatus Woesearchaeota archaeon]